MEQITVFEVFWLMLATAATSGLLIILSALVTGYLVFRTRKEQHDTLFPRKMKRRSGPVNIDEFATEVEKDDESGLPDVIKKQNERIMAETAIRSLKKVANG